MTNWILVLTRNNLHLTQKAVTTFLDQDIGNVRVMLIDDHSSDGTLQWSWTMHPQILSFPGMMLSGVAAMWNMGLELIFAEGVEHVLVCNNDVELRPDTYRHLVGDGGGFVTAVGVQERERFRQIEKDNPFAKGDEYPIPDPKAKRPHPDFSCFLIRKEVYEDVGPFDENFKGAYAEDWDMHVRLHKAGIDAHCIDLPFLHLAAQTVKNASPMEQEKIHRQAKLNRAYFKEKWGVEGGTEEYYALFSEASCSEASRKE